MKKICTFIFAAVLSLTAGNLLAQVNGTATAPVVSTLDNPIYYYIESAADGTVSTSGWTIDARGMVVFPTTNNLKMNYGAIPATKNNALWAIINDAGILKLYNKGTGWYLNNSHSAGTTQAGYEFALINGATKQYTMFSDGVMNQSRMLAWKTNTTDRWSSSQGANSLEAWYFVLPNTDVDLAISNATLLLNNYSAAGTQPGQYTDAARAQLQSAIDAATTVKNSGTQAEKDAAAATLSVAIDTYRSSRVTLAADGSKWYFLKGQRGSSATALYAENQGVASQVLNKDQAYTNMQAWKIVTNAAGYALVNKKDASYLNADINTPNNITTVANVPARTLAFYNRGQDAASSDYFHIENKITEPSTVTNASLVNFRLHSGSSGNNYGLVNYNLSTTVTTGAMYDNTLFQFIEAPATANTTYNPASGSSVPAGTAITITSSTANAVVYYTLDDTDPNTSATRLQITSGSTITAPSANFTLRSIAAAPNYFPSDATSAVYTIATGVKSTAGSPLKIAVNNGIITIDGIADFDVYAVSGQKVNAKTALKKGVYVVKANNFTQKVEVK